MRVDPAVLLGLLRHILTFVGGALVASGDLDQAQSETLVGGLMAILGVVLSIWNKRQVA